MGRPRPDGVRTRVDAPPFGDLAADLACNAGLIAAVVMVAAVIAVGRLFPPPAPIFFGLAALVILAPPAADVFWLRGRFSSVE